MRKIIVVGNGVSGLTCATEAAAAGIEVLLVSSVPIVGTSTDVDLLAGLTEKVRKYENEGTIKLSPGIRFHSLLMKDSVCHGALFYDERGRSLTAIYADAVVMATGGPFGVFGKTTRTAICDGYAAGKLFMQGVTLENLESIEFHPTTIETPNKRILISDAALKEGGRLYYNDGDNRIYFIEEKYGENAADISNDDISKCMFEAVGQVYLDIAFLGEDVINEKLPEVKEICKQYIGIDVTKESIPVSPAVHNFNGGISVDDAYRTNIERLYAIGDCASKPNGGSEAAQDIIANISKLETGDFQSALSEAAGQISRCTTSESKFPTVFVKHEAESIMNSIFSGDKTEEQLEDAITSMQYYIEAAGKLKFDGLVSVYDSYSLKATLVLANAILHSAKAKKQAADAGDKTMIVSYDDGEFSIKFVD